MQQAVATTAARDVDIVPGKDLEDFVTFFINDQMFGIPVLKVQDILTPDRIAPIPLAPPEIRGSINLRGRIVTVVDVRVRLGLEKRLPEKKAAPAAKESRRPRPAILEGFEPGHPGGLVAIVSSDSVDRPSCAAVAFYLYVAIICTQPTLVTRLIHIT